MTSPLPAQHSKTTLSESKNSQQGGFLNFCASPKSNQKASCESLTNQNDQHQERMEELEEAETAKKRKKSVDAATIAAQATDSGNLPSKAHLDPAEGLVPQPKSESEAQTADTTSKNTSADQSGVLQSDDHNQATQDSQFHTSENNPSITSTTRLPKLEAKKANNPLPVDATQAKNTPSLPVTDNLPLQPANPAVKSENISQTEPTNLIALKEELLNTDGQATISSDFNAFAAAASPNSLPASPVPQNSNPTPPLQIPSPTLQAALATASIPTNLQPASGEVIPDHNSGDPTQTPLPLLETLDKASTPLVPNFKPASQPTPADSQAPQANLPDSQQQEQAKILADTKQSADNVHPTENQKTSNLVPPALGSSIGIDHAVKEAKMISLATFESMESATIASPTVSAELKAPATSSDRSLTAKPLAVSNTIPLTAADKGADSTFAQLSSGNPLAAPTPENQQTTTHPASQAAAVLKTLPQEISKLQQSNLSQIQLDLPVGDNESVRIRLSLRGGEIHSTFITESAELRDALQKAWPDFTATHRTQGMRFADSQFQDGLRQQNDAASDQGRQRNQPQDSSPQSSDYRQPIVKKNIPQPPTQTNRQGKLNLWA